MDSNVTLDDVTTIIGTKEIENQLLRRRVSELEQENASLKAALEEEK